MRSDVWFERLGKRVSDILNAVGVQHCKGGIMASNAEWRMSSAALARDGRRPGSQRSKPRDILNTDIFFDSISVHGDIALGEEIRRRGPHQRCRLAAISCIFSR